MPCQCYIVPKKLLLRFSRDKKLSAARRKVFADAARFEDEWRRLRSAHALVSSKARTLLAAAPPSVAPAVITVYDCNRSSTLPGTPVPSPGSSTDPTARRAFNVTTAVADFYRTLFSRNSVDNAGKTLMSSIHFSVNYNNAFWNGNQMVYGDGDGQIFLDFTNSVDVIGHELTHGVTQFTAELVYQDEPGGLNESISDVFGSIFRQWTSKQSVANADWLIGKEIIGPVASARGFTCLRDMSNPAATHCLAPQPTKYSQYKKGMDPHDSSGIPNFAFYKAAMAIGGNSWDKVGPIWYAALTGSGPSPNLKMKAFANRTRSLAKSLFTSDPSVAAAVDSAWIAVGL